MLIVKIIIFLMVFNCEANNIIINELSENEKRNLSAYPKSTSYQIEQFETAILYANISNSSTFIEYYYSCDGLPETKDLDHTTFINNSNVGNRQLILDTGVVIKVSFTGNKKISNKELNRLYLISRAKSYALDLSSLRYNDIDYIQWCILSENSKEIEIMEYIKVLSKVQSTPIYKENQ